MSSIQFKVGGALTHDDAEVYVERKADHDALVHLQSMHYLLLIEPRQQGKTSLVNHLMSSPQLHNVAFAYVDVTTPDRSSESTWYQSLCPRILRQLRHSVPFDPSLPIPQNNTEWRDFLWALAASATDACQRIVIALDEIGAVAFPGATEFFSVLRDVYNSRQAETEFKQLTFMLVGTFHPRDLIKDDKISPFNVAERVRLYDFRGSEDIWGLVTHLVRPHRDYFSEDEYLERIKTISGRIHYWTDGQPYLTHWMCRYLTRYGPAVKPEHVDRGVEQLRRDDENHLPPIMERLETDERLCDYVKRIMDGERIKFYPRENRRQAQLELLGSIKADAEGYCVIRNQIYRQLLAHDASLSRMPQVLLNFTSAQSLIQQEWQPYGSKEDSVSLTLEHDTTLGRLALAKKGHGLDAAVRYKSPNHPPLGWKCPHYEFLVRMYSPSAICLNVLDDTGKSRTLLYSSEVLSGLNEWDEFQVPLGKEIVDGAWHSLLVDLPGHMDQAHWPGFQMVNWVSLRGEVVLAGIRGCDDRDSLARSVAVSPYVVHSATDSVGTAQPVEAATPQESAKYGPFPELDTALQRRTLALFIGADLPRDVTGLPSRADLVHDLSRRKGLDESLSLADVAQRVSQAGNRWEFTDFIRNALDTTGKSPQPFHQRIAALVKEHHVETLITTAYDNLLELVFQQAGVGINRVVRGSDVSFINPDRPTLIRLYGDAQQPDTLVVTDRDHSDLLRDREREPLIDEVRRAMRLNIVLFIGYNLADPDFRFLFDQVAESRFARTAYAVWPGLPEADVRMWRDRGIVILDVDPLGVLNTPAVNVPRDRTKSLSSVSTIAQETLYLDTTATLFAQWLADYTQMIPYRDFPTEKGRLILQSIKPPSSIQSPTTLEMDTIYIAPKGNEDAEIAWPIGAAITFRMVPLSSERVEVRAKCDQMVVANYFYELLAEIKQRWASSRAVPKTPPTPSHCSEPTSTQPVSQLSVGGEIMDYKRGLAQLKECLAHRAPDALAEFGTLEERFHKNERAERLFGSSENSRNEHSQIIYALNELALKHCGISFNDLCLGKQQPPQTQPATNDQEIIERLRRIETKLDQGRAEDRQAASQILDALTHNQVEQAEATEMVAELRAWVQTVQQAGLPLNPELRAAIDSLSQHTGSAYQYLQLAVPIIPGILSYNVELGSQHQLDLKTLWERIKARLGRKGTKGDGTVSSSNAQVINSGKAWAVLVGINTYEDAYIADLKVCVNDVTAIHQVLVPDYQVAKLLTDATPERLPTRANILGELSAVSQSASEGDLLLFYFSGHGVAEGGESYLLARDTRLSALDTTAVAMRDIRKYVEKSPARAKVIVLDACHSGAQIGKAAAVMTPEFIRRVFEEAEGMAVLASCKQGQQSWEWRDKGRSVFTYYLLEALTGSADFDPQKGFVTVSDISRYVTDGVKAWAAQEGVPQTPTLQYTVAGDIVLKYVK